MADAVKPGLLVNADSDPVAIRVLGRASFQNSSCLQDFLRERLKAGRSRFVMDFKDCTTMDSTFLGMLAGAALQLRKLSAPGSLVVCRLNERNLELLQNLGLHRLLTIDDGARVSLASAAGAQLDCGGKASELEQARRVLQAHENLVAADEANEAKFQDVLTFLKDQISKG
jgi:anti-sigma B factor antagonist